MTTRPTVTVWNTSGAAAESAPMPDVLSVPIRNDLIHFVHSNLAKNRRQGHGVFYKAGAEHSAESWGTGRAVARIPRISGSGTSRAGQATFGNQCRKARMFAPLKVWRKWHAKCNITMRRHAVASALAASACTPLVMARGHKVDTVPEFPLVLSGLASSKTKDLLDVLTKFGAGDELLKVKKNRHTRSGVGKFRTSRYCLAKGPLVIYDKDEDDVAQAARNIPGVDVCNVHRLNILQLAPGGHLGRFLIFTKAAFKCLDCVFGDFNKNSEEKKGYRLNRSVMECADISRIINSDSVQAVLRDIKHNVRVHDKNKKNPLTNKALMGRLNPFAKKANQLVQDAAKKRAADRKKLLAAKRGKAGGNKAKVARNQKWTALQEGLKASYKEAEDLIEEEQRQGNYVPGETDSEEDDE